MKLPHLVFAIITFASTAAMADPDHAQLDIFKKTSEALNHLKSISYSSYREINNFKENYFSKNTGETYIEYNPALEGKIAKFQLRSEEIFQVYNGTEYFLLNSKDKTAELEKRTVKQFSNLSLMYNSISTIRIALPLILKDESIRKIEKDTLIDGHPYYALKFELRKKSMEFPTGFSGFDADVTKYYTVIVDQKSYLPYMIFDRNSISKDQYYTKTVFTNLDVSPVAPAENSWYFSSYRGYIPKKKSVQKPIISVGSIMKPWQLPIYNGSQTDSLAFPQLKGKVVLLEFWIKNCGYCMQAFPEMKALQDRYGNRIEILSVNAYDSKTEIDFFYKREKPGYKMLYQGESLANELGITAYPATILIDQKGKIIYATEGFDRQKLEKALQTYVF